VDAAASLKTKILSAQQNSLKKFRDEGFAAHDSAVSLIKMEEDLFFWPQFKSAKQTLERVILRLFFSNFVL
jgi:hypothetical protein